MNSVIGAAAQQQAEQAATGFLFLLVIAMIVCAFVGAVIGGMKGRNVAGFFLGLFLGVIGLIIIAVLPRTPEAEAEFIRRRDVALSGLR